MELDLDKLKAFRVLGRGAMGTIFLVAPSCPDDYSPLPPLFALKVFVKHCPNPKLDADRRARWELSVLSRLSSAEHRNPFLPSLLGFVETPDFLAWAVPFCPGGDLYSLRQSLSPDAYFSPAAIRFYLSEIISAIGHLHSLRIAYRDLKPENVLIQSTGHITLTDFDLSRYLPIKACSANASPLLNLPPSLPPSPNHRDSSRRRHRHRRNLTRIFPFGGGGITSRLTSPDKGHFLKKARSARVSPISRRKTSFSFSGGERSFSFVGTEEYVSPEVVRGEGHEFSVDWWALGVLAYEMAYGRTPFRGRNRKETFMNVLNREPEFAGGRRRGDDLSDLIEHLLAKDPTRRLGYAGGAEEVKGHSFFRGVQWDLLAKVSRPPFLVSIEDLEEDYATAQSFDIRDYYKNLRQLPTSSESSPSRSSESLAEF